MKTFSCRFCGGSGVRRPEYDTVCDDPEIEYDTDCYKCSECGKLDFIDRPRVVVPCEPSPRYFSLQERGTNV